MKNVIMLLLLLTSGVYAQRQVFNVQEYCIDEKPFRKGTCDISGNEYSFVFLDVSKQEVVFFLTELKFEYQIIGSNSDSENTIYTLKNKTGETEMKVSNTKTQIEFHTPERHIYLTVGKSTKLASKT
jgi:hypothetical protein